MFVFWVLTLRARGDVSLIRCCRNCRQWFYAITNHQTSCSDRCRQQFHSKDKRFKENRRLYMRRYRNAEKERELRAEVARRSAETPKLKGR
jgi:predicted nucleic acid-binding Zn ribbon protein